MGEGVGVGLRVGVSSPSIALVGAGGCSVIVGISEGVLVGTGVGVPSKPIKTTSSSVLS